MIVRTSGLINKTSLINKMLKDKSVDMIAIGRKFINDPYWLIKEFNKNNFKNLVPNQYLRCFQNMREKVMGVIVALENYENFTKQNEKILKELSNRFDKIIVTKCHKFKN